MGWDIFWSRVAGGASVKGAAGQRLNMGGGSGYIDHADAIGSTTMETDPSGAVVWDIAYYPWGQVLAQGGTRQSQVFVGMDWQVNDPLMPSATRPAPARLLFSAHVASRGLGRYGDIPRVKCDISHLLDRAVIGPTKLIINTLFAFRNDFPNGAFR